MTAKIFAVLSSPAAFIDFLLTKIQRRLPLQSHYRKRSPLLSLKTKIRMQSSLFLRCSEQRHQTFRVSPKLNLTIVIMSLALKLVSYFAEFLMMNQSTFYISFKEGVRLISALFIAKLKLRKSKLINETVWFDPVMMELGVHN